MGAAMILPFPDLKAFAGTAPARVEEELAGYVQNQKSSVKSDVIRRTCIARIKALIGHVSGRLHERDREVAAVVAGLAAGVPTVLLGPPGTAKSLIAREIGLAAGLHSSTGESSTGDFGAGVDAAKGERPDEYYFEYLLTAHTMPEELFGPIDLIKLQSGTVQRKVDRMLPEANLVFLDEVFRGSSQILNTLLSILNEHRFHDGVRVVRVPLVGVIAASNDPPRDPDMQAFYDRFPVRVWVDSILEDPQGGPIGPTKEKVAKLLKTAIENDLRHFARTASGTGIAQEDRRFSCLNDFRCARALILREVAQTSQGGQDSDFREAVLEVRQLYRQLGKNLSDRALLAVRKMAAAFEVLGTDRRGAVMEALLLTAPDEQVKEAVLDYAHGKFHSSQD